MAPLSTQWSPASLAVVLAAPASEPLPGSDSMKHPTASPDAQGVRYLAFCSGVPYFSTGPQYSELLTDMMTPADAQPRLISSMAMA